MQNEKITKPSHQSKLSLKRSNSDSSQNTIDVKNNINNQESCSSDQSSHKENDPCPSNVEDSLADFKSPKEEKSYKPILNKFKIDAEKVRKKTVKPKSKSRKSSSSNINQPSIESSFFKPKITTNQTELKESIPCPLCLKPFKDDETCTNHMKTCAAKNKVSLKQLLDAKRLQDRQAEERKAMGLLAAPVLPEKKKGFHSKNFSTGDDPHLQLVLAMSESLYEAQQIEELEQAALLAGIPSECIKEMNDEDRKSTLQKFGFTTNKPATESTFNKPRKKKLMGPTILQTRSKEDKDRVLTERIACILTGDDALTQVQQRTDNFSEERKPAVLRSKILKEIEKTTNKLWDRSRLTKKCNNFYVEGLKNHFFQSDQKLQSESHNINHENTDGECNILCNTSVEYEPIDFDIIDDLHKEKNNSVLSNMTELNSKTYEIDFMKNLISNWGETLNDSTESDVIVFVKDEKHIYVHKLVFYVQCSNILLDIEPNDTISHRRITKKICWPDKDKLSALAFLEFIYCGSIKKYVSVFDQDNLLSEVQELARLYKVKDLFAYIRNKQSELKLMNEKESEKVISDAVNKSPKESNLHKNVHESIDLCGDISHSKDLSTHVQLTQTSNSLTKHNSDPTPMLQKSVLDKVNRSLSVQNFNDRRMTASPDLFESENEEEATLKTQTSNPTASNLNNTNLNILVNLINEDEKEDAETNHLEENSDGHQINSQKTIVNLSRTPSPTENLHEILTPKCRSPETGDNSKENTLNEIDMQISETVTPKQMSPVNLNSFEEDNIVSPKISEVVTYKSNSPNTQNDILKNTNLQKQTETSNMEIAKSDSSSKLDDCNISNAKTQEIEDDFYESIYTAVTPPKSTAMQFTLDKNNLKKLKTDLSLYIDKIKKENAKSILDSDSEGDTPVTLDRPRNPFSKRLRDDSYAYLINDKQKGNKKGISLLENQILEDENKMSTRADLLEKNKSTDFAKSSTTPFQTDFAKPQSPNQKEVSNNSPSCVIEKSSTSFTSNDEIEDITVDEVEMSRYSKYKKKNKHDNSIAKYRKELKQNSVKQNSSSGSINESAEKQNSSKDSSNPKNVLIKSIKEVNSQSVIEDITLVSDSDDDILQTNSSTVVSSHTASKKDNSLTDVDKEKSQAKMLTHATISNIENDSTIPLDLINSHIEPTKVVNSTALKEKPDNVIDLSSESEEDNIHNESTFPYSLAVESDNSLKKKKNENKDASTEKSKQMDLLNKSEKINNDVDAEISKILNSSPDFSIKSDNMTTDKTSNQSKKDSNKKKSNQSKKKGTDSNKDSNECEVITLSPLSIISSPEHEFDKETDDLNEKKDQSEDKECKNQNRSKKNVIEFDTIESACFDEIQFDDIFTKSESRKSESRSDRKSREQKSEGRSDRKSGGQKSGDRSDRKSQQSKSKNRSDKKSEQTKSKDRSDSKSHRSKSPTHNSSKKVLNFVENSDLKVKDYRESISPLSKSTSPTLPRTSNKSPILSQHRRKSRLSLDSASIKSSTSQRKNNKSPQEPLTVSNLEKEDEWLDEDSLPISPSYATPKNNRKSSQKVTVDKNGMTPPLDYSALETPELRKELKKYGVKSLARTHAKQILRHIYDETHPKVSAQKRASSTSEDEEPPPKKKNVNKGSKTTTKKEKSESNLTKNSKDCSMIAEEMEYDDSDVPNNVNNSVSIKDVFYRLLHTNKDLYNKVLTYEPLSLESLHLMLKQKGFKCKINSLMDFLDEQCITFQVQNGKGTRTKKKKS